MVQCNHKVLKRKSMMGSERKAEEEGDRDTEQQRQTERQRDRDGDAEMETQRAQTWPPRAQSRWQDAG